MGEIKVVQTSPFSDQKPGTSGLRKKVKVFTQENYTENFVQACFNALPDETVKGGTMVVGGDGRYFLIDALKIILSVGAAAGVSKFVVGIGGILSTPSASRAIRKLNASGGFILTASHNPGGPENDFGIKYNISNGGPAPENVTSKMFEASKNITEYRMADLGEGLDFEKVGSYKFNNGETVLEVVDGVELYTDYMKELFDFPALNTLLTSGDFKVRIDCMHGVTGPFAKRIFEKELGAPEGSVVRGTILPDFGGCHPDPNLTYAKELVEEMDKGIYDFGCAFDGDGDRNMVLGRGAFVNPSDSVAIMAANAQCVPYFKAGLKGLARSMPTSGALDYVAKKLNVELFETPTGWKFFGNLMDAGRLSICGEESFGQGSDHIREKDGIWAVLVWLSIIATTKKSVKNIIQDHWNEFGRNFFTRYDYEEVDTEGANKLMDALRKFAKDGSLNGTDLGCGYIVKMIDDFKYIDPIDQSVSEKQGMRILFSDGSRIIFRLSGTGSSGATVRMYIEKYEPNPEKTGVKAEDALKELVELALKTSKLEEFTGRKAPTVIT